MKIKNVKVGVRVVVVTNDVSEYGVVSGDTGTIVEAGSNAPWVQLDAHTNASSDKRWAVNASALRVLKPKHFPEGTKVVLVAEGNDVGVPVGTVGTVSVADGTKVWLSGTSVPAPKVQYEDGSTYWTPINQLGLVNE